MQSIFNISILSIFFQFLTFFFHFFVDFCSNQSYNNEWLQILQRFSNCWIVLLLFPFHGHVCCFVSTRLLKTIFCQTLKIFSFNRNSETHRKIEFKYAPHYVSKNLTNRRMLKKGLLIAKINNWNNSFQNMYDMP